MWICRKGGLTASNPRVYSTIVQQRCIGTVFQQPKGELRVLFHFHGRPLTMLAVAILVAVLAPAGAAKLRLSDLISPKELVHAVNATGLAWKYPPTHHHHHHRFSRVYSLRQRLPPAI